LASLAKSVTARSSAATPRAFGRAALGTIISIDRADQDEHPAQEPAARGDAEELKTSIRFALTRR
jgi:hypothetical protein